MLQMILCSLHYLAKYLVRDSHFKHINNNNNGKMLVSSQQCIPDNVLYLNSLACGRWSSFSPLTVTSVTSLKSKWNERGKTHVMWLQRPPSLFLYCNTHFLFSTHHWDMILKTHNLKKVYFGSWLQPIVSGIQGRNSKQRVMVEEIYLCHVSLEVENEGRSYRRRYTLPGTLSPLFQPASTS